MKVWEDMFLQNIELSPNYMALQPRKLCCPVETKFVWSTGKKLDVIT
jgi:hypothetical protein